VAYKWTTGSVNRGDVYYEDDRVGEPTYIDFGMDTITLRPSGTAQLYVEDGKVGIGTTSPDHTLHVKSPATCHVKVESEAGYEAALKIKSGGQSSAYVWMPGSTSDLRFYINGADVMHLDNDGKVGIGTTNPTEILTLNATDPTILFSEGGTGKATIGVNSSDNILVENKTINKHIVFKVNDQGVVKEGFRLDGAVPEVVVNQTSESLVDFRVESDNNTHMLFVDGANDKVGINTDTPNSGLHVNTSVTFAGKAVTQNYTVLSTDHMIFANATNGNITLTLPTAVGIIGRQYIIKRVDGSANSVIIDPNASETIEGDSNKSLTDQCSVVIVSDNNNWWITSEYISPPP
jgi:hypothetical protein